MLALAVPTPAAAYLDGGVDPADDVDDMMNMVVDLTSTTRRVWREDGRRWLAIRFRSSEDLDFGWNVDIRIDSRGGPNADALISTWNRGPEGDGCNMGLAIEPQRKIGVFRIGDRSAWCRIPLRWVDPDKRIRWRLVSYPHEGDFDDEHAPDHGWYG